MDQTKTGEFITQLSKQQGLTQKQLAEQLHVSVTAVCIWEKGVNAYSGNLNEQHSYELDEKIAIEILSKENIDADILYIEYYDDYDESIDYDIISFTFLPLSEIDSGSY